MRAAPGRPCSARSSRSGSRSRSSRSLLGSRAPGLPAYRYQPLNGDSFGFYAATREFISSIGRVSKPLLAARRSLVVVAAVVVAVRLWRGGSPDASLASRSCFPPPRSRSRSTLPIHQMQPPGAAVFGWPLLWSIPMIPIRAVGLDPVARHRLRRRLRADARRARRRGRRDGLRRPLRHRPPLDRPRRRRASSRVWPLVSGQIVVHSAWRNGQWNVDVGLHLYTEPLSTALVVTSVALLLRPATQQLGRAGAGLAIGYATAVKLTNGVVGAVLAVLVAWRHGWRQALPYAAGALVSLPIVDRLLAEGVRRHVRRRHLGLVAPVVALVRRRRLAALAALHAAAARCCSHRCS